MSFISIRDSTRPIAAEIENSFILLGGIFPIVLNKAHVLSFSPSAFTFDVVFLLEGLLFTMDPFNVTTYVFIVFKLNYDESSRTVFEANHIQEF